jgi:hypothetical protein
MELSKHDELIKFAYSKGYDFTMEGDIIGPSGKKLKLQITKNNNGVKYYRFGVKTKQNEKRNVNVHRFIAYHKFGNKIHEPGMYVRHLDNDSLNNSYDNIGIGTASDNQMDRPEEERMACSINAATKRRKFSDKEIEEIRKKHKNGSSYKTLMKEYNISSKGTISYIINNKYKTVV